MSVFVSVGYDMPYGQWEGGGVITARELILSWTLLTEELSAKK